MLIVSAIEDAARRDRTPRLGEEREDVAGTPVLDDLEGDDRSQARGRSSSQQRAARPLLPRSSPSARQPEAAIGLISMPLRGDSLLLEQPEKLSSSAPHVQDGPRRLRQQREIETLTL